MISIIFFSLVYFLSIAVCVLGKIDELRKKHAVEMADFEKAQTINKARTTQGLQEKLQARRSRRSRMQNHEREIEEMQSAWATHWEGDYPTQLQQKIKLLY